MSGEVAVDIAALIVLLACSIVGAWIVATQRSYVPKLIKETRMKLPIHLDLGEAFDLAPDVARFVGLLIKAKGRKSPGGKAITKAEKKELLGALKGVAKELVEDVKD